MERNDSHAIFLGFDISIDKEKLIYKMFFKRDIFNFHFVSMPSSKNNIPFIIFYGSTMSEFVRIAKLTLLLKDFLLVAKNLLDRMINQVDSTHLDF